MTPFSKAIHKYIAKCGICNTKLITYAAT